MKLKIIGVLSSVVLLFIAAKQTAVSDYLNLPASPFNYSITLPAYFTTNPLGSPGTFANLINTPIDNPITNHGATLGRVLFYDKNLS